jgi:glycosyltransferase involved in cell wall biosynthesis
VRIVHYLKWMRARDGGVVHCVSELSRLQAGAGHEVAVLTADDDDLSREQWRKIDAREAEDVGGTAFRGGSPTSVRVPLDDVLARLRGRSAAQAERDTPMQRLTGRALRIVDSVLRHADALHLHGPWSTSNAQVAARARAIGTPYVVSSHGMLDDWCMAQGSLKKRVHLALMGRDMFRGARRLHCAAEEEARQASRWARVSARVIPLPMDLSPLDRLPGPGLARERFSLRAGVPTVLFLSRLHPKKGADVLVEACERLARENAGKFQLVVAGPAQVALHAEAVRAHARRAGLDAVFPGMVVGELKWSLLQAADVFVLPTSQENFGFVLLEAMGAGTPVVTTRGVDIWREIEGAGARIVERDAEPIAGAIASALAMGEAARRELGLRGAAFVRSWLEPGALLAQYEDMYRGGADSGPGALASSEPARGG